MKLQTNLTNLLLINHWYPTLFLFTAWQREVPVCSRLLPLLPLSYTYYTYSLTTSLGRFLLLKAPLMVFSQIILGLSQGLVPSIIVSLARWSGQTIVAEIYLSWVVGGSLKTMDLIAVILLLSYFLSSNFLRYLFKLL